MSLTLNENIIRKHIWCTHIKEWKGKTESNNVVCILMCQIRLSEKGKEVCDWSVRRLLDKVWWNFILQFCICCHALERNDCKFARFRRSSFFYANKRLIEFYLPSSSNHPFSITPTSTHTHTQNNLKDVSLISPIFQHKLHFYREIPFNGWHS